jgi:hypothetical protein
MSNWVWQHVRSFWHFHCRIEAVIVGKHGKKENNYSSIHSGMCIVKKISAIISLILLLVIFPFLGSGAFANFFGGGSLGLKALVDPVNLFLFGIGLTFVGTRA